MSTLVVRSKASSGVIDQKSNGTFNSLSSELIVILQSGSLVSNKSAFLKSSTKKPVLNLDKPSAS